MPDLNTTSTLGTFRLTAPQTTAGYGAELSGVGWDEVVVGTTYCLRCNAGTGNAADEVIKGLTAVNWKGEQSAPWEQWDANITGGINTDYPIEPAFKWVFGQDTSVIYKVLYVIDNDTIAVEKHFASTPTLLYGIGTRGYAIKSVTISADSGDINVNGYNGSMVIPTGVVQTIPVNIDLSGPITADGAGNMSVNPINYDGQWL